MALDAFTPRVMSSGVRRMADSLSHFLTKTVFTQRNTHPTQIIDWGVLDQNAKIAKYSRPDEPAQVIAMTPGDLKTLQGPRLRMKKVFDEGKMTKLNPGFDSYKGPYTNPNDQIAEKVALEQKDLVMKFERMLEIQACQLLQTGVVTFTYVDNSTVSVNYGFTGDGAASGDSYNIQPAKSGTTRWNVSTGDPLEDLRTWSHQIEEYSDYNGDLVLIVGTAVGSALLGNAKVQALLDNRRMDVGAFDPRYRKRLLGILNSIEIWEYMMSYEAADSTRTAVWNANTAVLVPKGDAARFSVEYAAVYEFPSKESDHAEEIQTQWYSKIHRSEDPPVSSIIVETRPLCVCKDVKAIRKCTVVAAA